MVALPSEVVVMLVLTVVVLEVVKEVYCLSDREPQTKTDWDRDRDRQTAGQTETE